MKGGIEPARNRVIPEEARKVKKAGGIAERRLNRLGKKDGLREDILE